MYLISNNMGEELRIIYDEYFAFIRSVIVGALHNGLSDQSISQSIDIEKMEFFLLEVYRSFLKMQSNAYCDSSEEVHAKADKSIALYIKCILDHIRA